MGIDLDPRVETYPLLHRGICCNVASVPVEDNYSDAIFGRYLLEQISDPSEFLTETYRILRPGGRFIFLTPNKWHYGSLSARLTPQWLHEWYNMRLRGRSKVDTFPTTYLLNAAKSLRRQLFAAGFEDETLIMPEICPVYLCWSLPIFYFGLIYERLVNSTKLLAGFRVHLLGCYRKRL